MLNKIYLISVFFPAKTKKYFSPAVHIILIFFIAQTVWPDNNTTELLIVRGNGFYPPYEMIQDNQLEGIHIDLVTEVAEQLGIRVRFMSVPWKRAIYMLKNGDADAITFMSKTLEREQFGYFIEGNKIAKAQNGFFILKKNREKISYSGDLQDLRSCTIGTISGYVYPELFEQADYLVKDNGATNENILLKKLIGRRFYVAIGNIPTIRYVANIEGLSDQILFLKPYLPYNQNYLVFSKVRKHEKLAVRFAEAMTMFKKTPRFQELLKKYNIKREDF